MSISKKNIQLLQVFSTQGVGAVFAFFANIYVARNTSVEVYGQFSIVFGIVTIFVMGVLFGSPNFVLKFVSIIQGSFSKTKLAYSSGLGFIFINWVVLATVFLIVNKLFSIVTLSIESELFVLLWVLFTAFVQWSQNFERANGFVIRSMWPGLVLKPLLIALGIFIFMEVSGDLTEEGLYIIYFLSFILVFSFFLSLNIRFFSKEVVLKLQSNYPWYLKESKGYFINSVGQTLLKNVDILFIGYFLTKVDAGYFSAANKINLVVIFGLTALNMIYSPQVAKLFHKGDIKGLNESLKYPNFVIFLFAASVALLITFFGKNILTLFGNNYTSAYFILIGLSIRNVIESLFGITGGILNMTGNQKFFNKLIVGLLVAYAFIAPIFITFWGMNGLILFIILLTLVKNLVQWSFIFFKLKIRTGLISGFYSVLAREII